MTVSEITLFQILRQKIGDEQAQALVEFVEEKVNAEFEGKKICLQQKKI